VEFFPQFLPGILVKIPVSTYKPLIHYNLLTNIPPAYFSFLALILTMARLLKTCWQQAFWLLHIT
jgi:hypothetical protein